MWELSVKKNGKINHLYQSDLARFLSGFFYNAYGAMMNSLSNMITLAKIRTLAKITLKTSKLLLESFFQFFCNTILQQ